MLETMLKYQETDKGLKELENELMSSEERRKTASAKKFLDTVNDSVARMDKRAEELAGIYESLSADYRSLEEASGEFQGATEGVEDEAEADYLKKRAEELLTRMRTLEGKIAKLREESEQIVSQYNALKVKTRDAKEQYTVYGQKYKELKASRQGEIARIEGELGELEKSVDPALMQRYKAKRKDKMFPVLYELSGELCSHCRMSLSMVDINRLNNGEIIECDNCRCLIYKKK